MTRVNASLDAAIAAMLRDRPIAYHPVIARLCGSVTAGILLCQFLYWTPRTQISGWFYHTRAEIQEETCLNRYEQEGARKKLLERHLIEERLAGVPARMHFRVCIDQLKELLANNQDDAANQLAGFPPTGEATDDQAVGGEPSNQLAGFPPTKQRVRREYEQRLQTENRTPIAPFSKGAEHGQIPKRFRSRRSRNVVPVAGGVTSRMAAKVAALAGEPLESSP